MPKITKIEEPKPYAGNCEFTVMFVVTEDYAENEPPNEGDERLTAGMVETALRINRFNEGEGGIILFEVKGGFIQVVPRRSREEMLDFLCFMYQGSDNPDWDSSDMWEKMWDGHRGYEEMTTSEIFDEFAGLWTEDFEESYQEWKSQEENQHSHEEYVKIPFNLAKLKELVNSDPTDAHALLQEMLVDR
jgi:hypothetical protein